MNADRDRSEPPARPDDQDHLMHEPGTSRTDAARERRYAQAIMGRTVTTAAPAVMAVADAELAELWARVKSLDHRAEMNRVNWVLWRDRAQAAEAKVARVEALLDEGEMIWPDAPEWAVDGVREFTERLRAALAGPTEPDMTEGGGGRG